MPLTCDVAGFKIARAHPGHMHYEAERLVERVAGTAGALFCDGDRLMLVRKTYGNRWDIPGGYAEAGESPAAACRRELKEELALDREPQELLAVDRAPRRMRATKSSTFQLRAAGRRRGTDPALRRRARPVGVGTVSRLGDYVIPRLAPRLAHAYEALAGGAPIYLEHGEPSLRAPRTRYLPA